MIFNTHRSQGRAGGFTLIELLVVIAIIALLAGIILASLNTARMKARDATRISSLQEMSKAISVKDTDPSPYICKASGVNCTGGGSSLCASGADVRTCAYIGDSVSTVDSGLTGYTDPSTPGTACTISSTATCQYVFLVTGDPTTQNFEICTYLENGTAGLSGGSDTLHLASVSASSSSSVIAGC